MPRNTDDTWSDEEDIIVTPQKGKLVVHDSPESEAGRTHTEYVI